MISYKRFYFNTTANHLFPISVDKNTSTHLTCQLQKLPVNFFFTEQYVKNHIDEMYHINHHSWGGATLYAKKSIYKQITLCSLNPSYNVRKKCFFFAFRDLKESFTSYTTTQRYTLIYSENEKHLLFKTPTGKIIFLLMILLNKNN